LFLVCSYVIIRHIFGSITWVLGVDYF
jgi:hypothetical protein